MKILINYADEEFRLIRDFNSLAGRKIGGFDKVIEYSPEDLDPLLSPPGNNLATY